MYSNGHENIIIKDDCTDNQCEWWALVEALKYISVCDSEEKFIVHTDSLLLYRQIIGEYRIKSKSLKPIYFIWNRYKNLLRKLDISYEYVERRKNPARRLLDES